MCQRTMASRLLEGLRRGCRADLARSITLVESTSSKHRGDAEALLNGLLSLQSQQLQSWSHANNNIPRRSFRIGLSGAPGCGKSTFIDNFGSYLTSQGHRVAVLAVDPSSLRTGGSILGDKTRMRRLACDPNAYIRPTPAGRSLGGVARNTSEAIELCEGAGYDTILIETVGVGQSETKVSEMVDMFALLIAPAAGDELQGLKKGIVELADLVVITKADGDLVPAAQRAKAEYTSALKLLQHRSPLWRPHVVSVSSLENHGLDNVLNAMKEFERKMNSDGELDRRRTEQRVSWFWSYIEDRLLNNFMKVVPKAAIDVEISAVREAIKTPRSAANSLLY